MKYLLLTLIIASLLSSINKAACMSVAKSCSETEENRHNKEEKESKAVATHMRNQISFDQFLPDLPLELQALIRQYFIENPFDFLPIYLQGKNLALQDIYISDIAIDSNGTIVACRNSSPLIETWNKHGAQTRTIDSGSQDTRAIACDNNNNIILCYCKRKDNGAYEYEYGIKILKKDGTLLHTSLPEHKEIISKIVCHNDTIVTGSHDNTVKIWNYKGECTDTLRSPHGRGIWSVAISPDGKTIIAGGGHNYDHYVVHMWNDKQYVKSLNHRGSAPSWPGCEFIAISSDGQTVATNDTYKIQIWDINGNTKATFEVPKSRKHNLQVYDLAYLQNSILAAGYSDCSMRFWRPDGTVIATLTLDGNESPWRIVIGKYNTLVASGSGMGDGKIKLWRPNEQLLHSLTLQQLDFMSRLIIYIEQYAYTAECRTENLTLSAEQIAQFKQLPVAVQACFQDFYQLKIELQPIEQKHFVIQ